MKESFIQSGDTPILLAMLLVAFILGYLLSYFINRNKYGKVIKGIDFKMNGHLTAAREENKNLQLKVTKLEEELNETWMQSKDDLKLIEGIGPVIEDMLNKEGIYKWKQLKREDIERLKNIIYKGGDNFKIHDPATWPKQADLADSGNWEELKKWQKLLKGGKMV